MEIGLSPAAAESVIPAKAGIQNLAGEMRRLTRYGSEESDHRFRGNDGANKKDAP